MKQKILFIIIICLSIFSMAQSLPSGDENIEYLTTFSNEAAKKWGDDDHQQVCFFIIPENQQKPIYIRVFDPNIGGAIDQVNHKFNSHTKFSVYGGKEAFLHPEKTLNPSSYSHKGTLLASKVFNQSPTYDSKWYSFGPFNPKEGYYSEQYKGYIFKMVCDGEAGDDGNLYRYFLSEKENENTAVLGANIFTYEYSVRLISKKGNVTHIYPFIQHNVVAVRFHSFDFDQDGEILLYSTTKNRHPVKLSEDGTWMVSEHQIDVKERNGTVDFQIIKKGDFNNDMVLYITNEYNEPVPIFSVPLGGKPKFEYSTPTVKLKRKGK